MNSEMEYRMTEQQNEQTGTTDEAVEESSETTTQAATQEQDATDWKARAEAQQKVNRDLERKFKVAQGEVEKARQASMSEAEKAIAEAEVRGRTNAVTEFGKRLARTQFDALAGRRNADYDTSQALEYLDLSKFVDEDGEPDGKAIAAAVERLVPEAAPAAPSFDGGVRKSPSSAVDMNALMRSALGRNT